MDPSLNILQQYNQWKMNLSYLWRLCSELKTESERRKQWEAVKQGHHNIITHPFACLEDPTEPRVPVNVQRMDQHPTGTNPCPHTGLTVRDKKHLEKCEVIQESKRRDRGEWSNVTGRTVGYLSPLSQANHRGDFLKWHKLPSAASSITHSIHHLMK